MLAHTCSTSEILHAIYCMGYAPSNPEDLSPEDASSTPELLVAIGSTVPHPQRKHTHVPAFVAFDKKGNKVHVIDEGSLHTNIEVAIKAA